MCCIIAYNLSVRQTLIFMRKVPEESLTPRHLWAGWPDRRKGEKKHYKPKHKKLPQCKCHCKGNGCSGRVCAFFFTCVNWNNTNAIAAYRIFKCKVKNVSSIFSCLMLKSLWWCTWILYTSHLLYIMQESHAFTLKILISYTRVIFLCLTNISKWIFL